MNIRSEGVWKRAAGDGEWFDWKLRLCGKRGLKTYWATSSFWLESLGCNWFELTGNMWEKGKSRSVKLRIRVDFKGENRKDMIFGSLTVWCVKEEQAEWRKAHLIRIRKSNITKGDRMIDWNHVRSRSS